MKRKPIHTSIFLYLFLCVILESCHFKKDSIKIIETEIDSVSLWIKSSKDTSYSLAERKIFLNKSYDRIISGQIDLFATKTLSKIAYQYLNLKDIRNFKKTNNEAYRLALKIKDTFTLADSHWSTANFYKKREAYDSAFYHYNSAYNYFESIDKQYYAAKMLYTMAFIKGRYRDYTGSEILIFKAISKYKLLKKNKSLYASYNHLALLQSDIREHDKALFYHNKALTYIEKFKNKKNFYEASLNNIGNVYIDKGNYSKALDYFNRILKNDSLIINDIEHYARVVDNKAYCKLLSKDTINLLQDFEISLKIRDSINSKEGIVISKIHLAEYYKYAKDTLKALTYAKEANVLAKEIKNSRDYLASLKLLAKLDTKQAENYLEKHIQFSDSLQNVERKIQNKFTKIAYETDEYIEETKRLSQQKIWIAVTGLGAVSIVLLFYFLSSQKSKNEKLVLEAEQQKSNEQVYILTLKQQAKFEEERIKERNRISKEIHDGILGKLFGTRIALGFLNMKGDNATLKEYKSFLEELQHIEKEIREVSHKLSTNFSSSSINFTTIISQLLENKSKIGQFKPQLTIDEHIPWEEINEIIKVNLYRIFQEALQNIVKYAKATNVRLDLLIEKENLVVHIQDDGIGFHVAKTKGGIGIKNMKSRVQQLKGTLYLHSEIKRGTDIHIKIPIE